jgi:Tfp pilus assembly protein PilN
MSNIDFVPNDYFQQRESNRANILFMVLFAILMTAIATTFALIKIRQKLAAREMAAVEAEMQKAQKQIDQLDEVKRKYHNLKETADMAAALIEQVPRSVLLAELINKLPEGVSLVQFEMETEKRNNYRSTRNISQYKKKSANKPDSDNVEDHLEQQIEITGIAPSDIEVANYIAALTESLLLADVALVESKEHKNKEGQNFREFKLEALMGHDIELTKTDLDEIVNYRQ